MSDYENNGLADDMDDAKNAAIDGAETLASLGKGSTDAGASAAETKAASEAGSAAASQAASEAVENVAATAAEGGTAAGGMSVGWIIIIVLLVILFVILIACLIPSTMDTFFGYENCSEYVDDSVKIETELICDGLKKLYGTDTTNQSNINSAFVKFDGSKQSVTGAELPSGGILEPCYTQIEEDYVSKSSSPAEDTFYDGYTVKSDLDDFWTTDKYIDYLSPLVQNNFSGSLMKAVTNADTSQISVINRALKSNIKKLGKKWASWEVESITDNPMEIQVSTTAEDGSTTYTSKMQHHYIVNYKIKFSPPTEIAIHSSDYKFKLVTDQSTMNMVVSMLQYLSSEQVTNIMKSGLKVGGDIRKTFEKMFSWRSVVTFLDGSIVGNSDGNTAYGDDGEHSESGYDNYDGDLPDVSGEEGQIIYLAGVIWAEARNQPEIGQIAVGYVVMNRVHQRGMTVDQVVSVPGQFETCRNGSWQKGCNMFAGMSDAERQSNLSWKCAVLAYTGVGTNPIGNRVFFRVPANANDLSNYKNPVLIGGHVFHDGQYNWKRG